MIEDRIRQYTAFLWWRCALVSEFYGSFITLTPPRDRVVLFWKLELAFCALLFHDHWHKPPLPPFSQLEAVADGEYPPLSPMSFTIPEEEIAGEDSDALFQ